MGIFVTSALNEVWDTKEIQISIFRKGTPIDESPIEIWQALLKKKLCIIMISHLYKNLLI